MISIVIPAYNEEKRIGKTLEFYERFFKEKKEKKELDDFEILIVINNTTDKTEKIVKEFSKKNKEVRYLNFKEGGKGFAIIEGFKDALKRKNNLIGFVDADMSTPPEAFYDLIKVLDRHKEIDGTIADRWNKKSIIGSKQTLIRRFVSRGYNFIVRTLFLFPYKDTQCGAKVFRREIIEKNIHRIITIGWGFDIAMLFCFKKESNAKIISIPTIWEDKQASHINLKKIPILMFASSIRLRLLHSPLHFIVRFYRKLPNKLKIQKS
jgi:glycosyltransferase involved in cell wall biosynthesis